MGTVMTHRAFGPQAEECLSAVCAEIDRLEQALSRFLPESDISRINRCAGIGREKVSQDTFRVLGQAAELTKRCQGCFDVTIGPLVALWGQNKETSTTPDAASIRQALALVNARDLALDPRQSAAGLRKVGQSIDLGGIGKGYAGDKILEIYQRFGVTSAYSNLGGNVVTLGAKPDGSPWQIGIQHPRQEGKIIGAVAVEGQTVITSGDYQRYYTDSRGRRCHHILDPTTGYPAESGLVSVTIVAESSMVADALSTIVFVAGMERGLRLLRRFPRTEAVVVDSALQVYVTPGLRYRFQADAGVDVTILDWTELRDTRRGGKAR